jgi:hypothetical protein
MNSDSQDTVDLSLQNFDFSSSLALQAMMKALDLPGKVKVLKKLISLPPERVMEVVRINPSVRNLLLAHKQTVLPHGVIGSIDVQREVINNPVMPKKSSKSFAICSFMPAHIAKFIRTQFQEFFG